LDKAFLIRFIKLPYQQSGRLPPCKHVPYHTGLLFKNVDFSISRRFEPVPFEPSLEQLFLEKHHYKAMTTDQYIFIVVYHQLISEQFDTHFELIG
jgi:hypothetical protein